MVHAIGIDVGGTLTKVAFFDDNQKLTFLYFLSDDLQRVSDWIALFDDDVKIGLTGGRAEQLKTFLRCHDNLHYLVEFDATVAGVNYQLQKDGKNFPDAVITNIGTGTSIHYHRGDEHKRISGTGIGGGTLLGMSALMTGIHQFDEIVQLSARGSRSEVDMLVSDIYFGNKTPIDGGLTASNFGAAGLTPLMERSKEDILATVQGLVGEVISTLSIQCAFAEDVEHIVYIGSTLSGNIPLQNIIGNYTKRKNRTPIFLRDNGYSGAIGALLSIRKEN
ncbi:type II pantothenate kinase [Paenisporosarcina antarctica]|uniref:Type II pantothenate kinase n=1 Tax=Paenisporosarcina antarctica TaxID=417367 RepID=A0A4P6ZX55_9BACL|nr:type II pantothenate kinase [Paenisporosarcina antarctica]QBP41200.1 type II pantothenate kinase [Paenisporosarcina antarctica]